MARPPASHRLHADHLPTRFSAEPPHRCRRKPIGPTVERRSTWLELQEHASQPADRTTCDEETLDMAWGSEALLALHRQGCGPRDAFLVGKRLPGMPVLVGTRVQDVPAGRSEMVATTVPSD